MQTRKQILKPAPILKKMSIKEILKFVGGDQNVVIMVGRKSLVDLKTRQDRAAAAAALDA